jgi:hypothetical protein
MRRLARRFLMILCMLALVGSSTISFAASVTAIDPCAHEHGEHGGAVPSHHDHHGAGCLACCLGACTATADLPPRPFITVAAFVATAVIWWEAGISLTGRSIAPDLGPPRTIA